MPFFFSKRAGSTAEPQEPATSKPSQVGVRRAPGQVDAFEEELLSHLDALYSVGLRMTRRGSEAEDLVQDTVIKAMRARHQFQAGTSMKAWLLRILTNTFLSRHRRRGLERSVFEGADVGPLADAWTGASTLRGVRDAEGLALSPLLESEVQRALDALPDDYRVAVVLSDIEELSYKEIAEAMGCPIGTVMSRLHRGRRALQAALQDQALSLGLIATAAEPKAPADLNAFRQRRQAKTG